MASGGKTGSDHTTFVAIHSTEDEQHHALGMVSSPTTAGSSSASHSDSGGDAVAGTTGATGPASIPAFPKEHDASEVVEAGGGGLIKRARSSSGSSIGAGLRTPLAAKSLHELEEGGHGHGMSGLALLSPRSLGMECPPSPLRSDVDAGDVRSSVSQMLEDFLHLPRWQFRLMIGVIIFLFSSLVILIILSTLYGAFWGFWVGFVGWEAVVRSIDRQAHLFDTIHPIPISQPTNQPTNPHYQASC